MLWGLNFGLPEGGFPVDNYGSIQFKNEFSDPGEKKISPVVRFQEWMIRNNKSEVYEHQYHFSMTSS
jgi:hypothetical protein